MISRSCPSLYTIYPGYCSFQGARSIQRNELTNTPISLYMAQSAVPHAVVTLFIRGRDYVITYGVVSRYSAVHYKTKLYAAEKMLSMKYRPWFVFVKGIPCLVINGMVHKTHYIFVIWVTGFPVTLLYVKQLQTNKNTALQGTLMQKSFLHYGIRYYWMCVAYSPIFFSVASLALRR